MKLNVATTQKLIEELSSVIEYNLNIMDDEGIIISSTDPGRVGQFHEAALLIINQNLPSLLVNYDNEYHGCREGTNVPLLVDDTIIGVVGITGKVSETSKYATIIKKTAEILLKDYVSLSETTRINEARMSFLNSWLNGEIRDVNRIRSKLEQYGCGTSSTFQVVIVDDIRGHDSARSFLREMINSPHTITTWNNYGIIIGMFDSSQDMADYLRSITGNLPGNENLFFSIGDTIRNDDLLNQSYSHAFSLLQLIKKRSLALNTRYNGIAFYSDYILDIIMDNVPDTTKRDYVSSIFHDLSQQNLEDTISFILTYCECSGSINAIAKKLFIHKNTVQYKIKRIRNATGLDLRSAPDMIRLHAAAEWFLHIT